MALWNRAVTDAARLAGADQAREKGEIAVASRLYVRLAMSHPANESTAAAKQRLSQLAKDARLKLGEIDTALSREASLVSPGELLAPGSRDSDDQPVAQFRDRVVKAFRQYDRLAQDYQGVPVVAGEIKRHVAKQRRRTEFAVVLNEPEAKALWEVAQQHEAQDHACCAYWVYRQAARLVPAPSARLAEKRLAQLEKDPQLVASAEACRELQQCHQIYNRAKRLIKLKPDQAEKLFAQIVQRAPADSEVYRAAQEHLQALPQ